MTPAAAAAAVNDSLAPWLEEQSQQLLGVKLATIIDAMAERCSTARTDVLTPVYRLPPEKIHNPAVVKLAHDGLPHLFAQRAAPCA